MLYPAELPGRSQRAVGLAGAVWTKAPRAGKTVSMDLRAARASLRRFGRLRAGCAALALASVASLVAVDFRPARRAGRRTERAGRGRRRSTRPRPRRRPHGALGRRRAPRPGAGARTRRGGAAAIAGRIAGRDGELERLASGADRWGRVVADILFSGPGGGPAGPAAATLLAAGYARVWPAFEARGCVAERLRIEDEARRGGLGLWADPGAAVIDAADAAALRENDGRFVVIEGQVRRVGSGARAFILTSCLGAGRRSSFPEARGGFRARGASGGSRSRGDRPCAGGA